MDGKVTSASENKRGEESERHKEIKKTDVREDHKETKGKQKTKEVERELCDKKFRGTVTNQKLRLKPQ